MLCLVLSIFLNNLFTSHSIEIVPIGSAHRRLLLDSRFIPMIIEELENFLYTPIVLWSPFIMHLHDNLLNLYPILLLNASKYIQLGSLHIYFQQVDAFNPFFTYD